MEAAFGLRERAASRTKHGVVETNEEVPLGRLTAKWRIGLTDLKAATNASSLSIDGLKEGPTGLAIARIPLTVPLAGLSKDGIRIH